MCVCVRCLLWGIAGLIPYDCLDSQQRLKALEGVERERLRLEAALREEREVRSTLDEQEKASREVGGLVRAINRSLCCKRFVSLRTELCYYFAVAEENQTNDQHNSRDAPM